MVWSQPVMDDMDSEEMIINEVDGLPSVHPGLMEAAEPPQRTAATSSIDDLVNDEDLPTSLIVTNLQPAVFTSEPLKKELEDMFTQFGETVSFQYFRSFKRMRVNFSHPASAAKARIQLHQTSFGENIINCYFAQPVTPIDSADQYLQPPAPVKQFLISPPASPPVGWQPTEESEPIINYDLLAAIANLTPGGAHEIHTGSDNQPGIIVHVCEEQASLNKFSKQIPHTRYPQP